ncbi:LapA family protein [Halocynthiibacter namhaensis]|uniref:LapA family protein n=1 Tax=Halocynthiibacter namhaensis TaxID=1290553 RepID=UPI0005791D4E|nr:LapA family protein [Halocynthiibacter namhaensis]
MRYIKYVFLGALAVLLIMVALANRAMVSLYILPQEISEAIGLSGEPLQLPLFVVVVGGIILGLLVGFVWEWLRESKFRGTARKAGKLEKEIDRLRAETSTEKGGQADDVLALLDGKA